LAAEAADDFCGVGCDNPFKGGSDVFAGGSVDLFEE